MANTDELLGRLNAVELLASQALAMLLYKIECDVDREEFAAGLAMEMERRLPTLRPELRDHALRSTVEMMDAALGTAKFLRKQMAAEPGD